MKKILTIGGGTQDIFTQYDEVETLHLCTAGQEASYIIMRAGLKIEIQQLSYYSGGGAVNSAVSFSRAGFDVAIFIKVGIDQAGDFIIQTLKSENIGTDYIVKTDKAATGTSFIVPGPQGNRSVLVYRGANLLLATSPVPEEAIAQSDQLYITSLSGPTAPLLPKLTALAKKYKKQVAVNPGTSQLRVNTQSFKDALPCIDIVILNSHEAQLLMTSLTLAALHYDMPQEERDGLPALLKKPLGSSVTCFTLFQFFHEIHSHGPRIVVVTNGIEGVYASDGTYVYFHPSIKTDIVSSIGAGDAFGSTFTAGIMKDKSIEDAMRMGVINSASVITFLGTQTGLLLADELEDRLKKMDQSLIKKYRLS